MKHGHGRGGIDGGGRKRRPGVCAEAGSARESIQRLRLVVGLYPRAHIERPAVRDVAFEDRFVGYQDLRAAIGQNAAHFGEREKRVQGNRDASGADDRQKPVKGLPVVAAIDGHRLARFERDRAAEKVIDG